MSFFSDNNFDTIGIESRLSYADSVEVAVRENVTNSASDIYADLKMDRTAFLSDIGRGVYLEFSRGKTRVAAPKYGYLKEMGELKSYSRFWDKNKVLRIRFLGKVNKRIEDNIKYHIDMWIRATALRVEYVDSTLSADIRIAVNESGSISKTFVGTDAKYFAGKQNMATLLLSGLSDNTPENIFSYKVLHEIGHALGLVHAHQEPDAKIPWIEDKDEIYRVYREMKNLSDQEVYDNYLNKYVAKNLYSNGYEETSIMHCFIPGRLLKDKRDRKISSSLSPEDIALISAIYG